MEYTRLGNSGLEISRLCLGTMSYGNPDKWIHSWVLKEEEARKIIKRALELGINFFDTANVYGLGASEEILGRALKDYANRDEVVIATKVSGKMFEGPNGGGLSRKSIISEVEKSLKRLQTDYIDLLIIHRWDYNTPIKETMETLHDLIKSGKVRYIGASSMYAWQFQKAQYIAKMNGFTEFISMQNHYNLLYREEEREMIPLCIDLKVSITPYSPLASGRLAKDSGETSKRLEEDTIAKQKYDSTAIEDNIIIERLSEISKKRNIPRNQLALAWLLQKNYLAAPIIGATKISHLESAVAALNIKLSTEEIHYLEEGYKPHNVVGIASYK